MSTMNFAYTVPFPKVTKITKEQAFEALRAKARDPLKFVPLFVACEVLEETPTYIKRKATTTTGEVLTEDIDLYKPSLVSFKADNGSFVSNLISETSDGSLLLTFNFAFAWSYVLQGAEPGTEAATTKEQELKVACQGVVGISLKTTMDMFESGALN
ncbi:hypothetical protein BDV93DRAFT_603086 [Ceratobasidium sp. AG-I]|nr:hypothetical protein BDV93DRAFT_603086 [Ceratobasidium sp. AG-I]